jgi:proline iminopeptidase
MNAPDVVRSLLYPEIAPYVTGYLRLDDVHSMYWETSGNAHGIPVLFLHGGPGAGATPAHRRFFDPEAFRIVIVDQRGAGRSRPLGELTGNTTRHLVADIEQLRSHLGIERWVVFGGSWGSTLALAYAQAHPRACLALVLRGIFLCRQQEIAWFLHGMRRFFPEAWRAFAGYFPESERDDLLGAYLKRLNDPDPAVHMPAARNWSEYEGACSTLLPNPATVAHYTEDVVALGLARIEAHYFASGGFLAENELLANAGKLRGIRGIIVQGRYDVVCPIETADALHRAWPEAEYIIVPDAGHSAWEPGICARLVAAMEKLKGIDHPSHPGPLARLSPGPSPQSGEGSLAS